MEKKHKKHPETLDVGDRNNKKVTVPRRSRLFHFTSFLPTQDAHNFLMNKIENSKNIGILAYQSEVCPSTEKTHIQGLVYYKNCRIRGPDLFNEWENFHIDHGKKNIHAGLNYVLKAETFDGKCRVHWTMCGGFQIFLKPEEEPAISQPTQTLLDHHGNLTVWGANKLEKELFDFIGMGDLYEEFLNPSW